MITSIQSKSALAAFGPTAVLLEFEAPGFELHAGDGGMRAQALKGRRVEFPGQRGAGLGHGRDPILENKGEFHARLADLFIQGFPQQMQKGGQFGMGRLEEPRDLAHEAADLDIERGSIP